MEDAEMRSIIPEIAQLSGEERQQLTGRRGEGGRLKPSALIFVTKLRVFFAGTAGNPRRALRGELPLRVKSPWREVLSHGLRQHQAEL